MRSTMRGDAVHLAPSGAAGRSMRQSPPFDCGGTRMTKETERPSGDHFTLEGDSVRRVTCVVAPSASIQRTKIWVPFGSPGAR